MIESDPGAQPSGSSAVRQATLPRSASADETPLRFLVIRTKGGELPWLAQTLAHFMAPVEIVQVIGMPNALWRLGQERFDSVLLDIPVADRRIVRRCREQIADIAVVPVLDLHDQSEAAVKQATAMPPRKRPAAVEPAPAPRQTMRLPWLRRGKRQPSAPQPQIASLG
jgi:hypothetical protein